MIDTVRCVMAGTWNDDIPEGWTVLESCNSMYQGGREGRESQVKRRCVHEESGMRVFGDSQGPSELEVSLPRVYKGFNGYIIKDQEDLDNAWRAFWRVLAQISVDCDIRHFTRVDLVWHFRGDIREWTNALRLAKHPRIQSGSQCYDLESIRWQGSEMLIRIYDKAAEMRLGERTPSDVGGVFRFETVRPEIQLRKGMLKELLGENRQMVGFETCWRHYRHLLLQLQPQETLELEQERGSALWGILSLGEKLGLTVNGQTLFDIWAAGKSRASIYRGRSQVNAAMVYLKQWELSEVIPEMPGEVLDVEDRPGEVTVPGILASTLDLDCWQEPTFQYYQAIANATGKSIEQVREWHQEVECS